MFRRAMQQLDGQDPFTVLNLKLEQTRAQINSRPFSETKKRLVNAYLNYWSDKVNHLGLISAAGMLFNAEQMAEVAHQFFQLLPYPDDQFPAGVKNLALTMPQKSSLKTILMAEHEVAMKSLAERRASVHQAVMYTAIFTTLFALYEKPALGLLALGIEMATLLNVDVNQALDNVLEMYDSTGYMDVEKNGKTERMLMTTYMQ